MGDDKTLLLRINELGVFLHKRFEFQKRHENCISPLATTNVELRSVIA